MNTISEVVLRLFHDEIVCISQPLLHTDRDTTYLLGDTDCSHETQKKQYTFLRELNRFVQKFYVVALGGQNKVFMLWLV
jgi:hypothetical protein